MERVVARLRHPSILRLIIVAIGGAAVSAFLLTAGEAAASKHQPRRPVVITRAVAASWHRELMANFAVLRRPGRMARVAGSTASVLPAAIASDLSSNNPVAADVGAAVDVATADSGHVWVVPGQLGACMVVPQTAPGDLPGSYVSSCNRAPRLDAGKFRLAEFAGGAEILVGLAPNGNRSVSFTRVEGGAPINVPVVNNVYVADTAAHGGGAWRSFVVRAASGQAETYAGAR